MIKLRLAAVAVLVLAGCGSKSSDDQPAASPGDPSTCAGAIGAGLTTLSDTRKKALDERMGSQTDGSAKEVRILERSQKVIEMMRGVLVTHCTDDKWAPETLACFAAVARREDVTVCLSKLPGDQARRVNEELSMRPAGGPMRGRPMMPNGAGGLPPAAPAPVAPAPAPAPPAPAK